jgi:hypothetical protein
MCRSIFYWTIQDQIYIVDQYQEGEINSIITLIIDYNQEKLPIQNEQIDRIMELSVTINKFCTFMNTSLESSHYIYRYTYFTITQIEKIISIIYYYLTITLHNLLFLS